MRASHAVCAAIAVSACSCSSEDLVFVPTPDVPAEVEWIVALAEDASGELVASTPFVRAGSPIRFPALAEGRASVLELAGFTAAQMTAMRAPDDVVLLEDRVVVAKDCAPAIDTPFFRTRFYVNGEAADPTASPRALTVKWLESICPDYGNKVSVDLQCRLIPCPTFSRQEGCTLTVDLANCGEGEYSGRLDWRGQLCGETSNKPACRFGAAKVPAIATVNCTPQCDHDIFAPVEEPLFQVESTLVVRGAVARPTGQVLSIGLREWSDLTGYVSGIVALRDRIAVSTHDGRFQENIPCDQFEPSRLVFLDKETLDEIGTTTAPPCLSRLIATPEADTFYGVHGQRTNDARIVELDEDGRVLREGVIDLEAVATRTYDHVDALISRVTGEAVIDFFWGENGGFTTGNTIVAVDLTTFATRTLWQATGSESYSIAEADDGVLAISDDSEDRVVFVDVRTGQLISIIDRVVHQTSISVGDLAWHGGTGDFVVSVPFEEPNIHLLTPDADRVHATFFERDAGPTHALDWPTNPELMLVAAAYAKRDPVRDAYIALADPRVPRFLPGAVRVGFGLTGKLIADGNHIWATLPWEGSVIRIAPN